MSASIRVGRAEELDLDAMGAVIDGAALRLDDALLEAVGARRRAVLDALETGDPVYGVTTGMGAASEVRLDDAEQSTHQNTLMLGRAVGSAPWLDREEARAVMVVRLRTLLSGEAGVSRQLCTRLVELLNRNLIPAIPRTRNGAAGEIIALAHLGGAITGSGEFIGPTGCAPAEEVLATVGLAPLRLGPKEGVSLIEGVPVTTGLALLCLREARLLGDQSVAAVAAGLAIVGANRDPFTSPVARGDAQLGGVLTAILRLAGRPGEVRALQAPLSFRIAGPAIAVLSRSIDGLELAVARALDGVTDSPAFLDGSFVGTAGFDGFDLASALDSLRIALIHLADTSAARLHRMLDDRVTGLPRQLSDRPGLHAGMVAVHKRAVGVLHSLHLRSAPASLGAIETSLGQEDVQSFSIEAAVACSDAIAGVRDILACELLAITQATRLSDGPPIGVDGDLLNLLDSIAQSLPAGTADRPFGRDIEAICRMLATGWARGILVAEPPSTREK